MASSASQRRTVEADESATKPSATAWAASSAELQRERGTSRLDGGSQAMAFTWATTSPG